MIVVFAYRFKSRAKSVFERFGISVARVSVNVVERFHPAAHRPGLPDVVLREINVGHGFAYARFERGFKAARKDRIGVENEIILIVIKF